MTTPARFRANRRTARSRSRTWSGSAPTWLAGPARGRTAAARQGRPLGGRPANAPGGPPGIARASASRTNRTGSRRMAAVDPEPQPGGCAAQADGAEARRSPGVVARRGARPIGVAPGTVAGRRAVLAQRACDPPGGALADGRIARRRFPKASAARSSCITCRAGRWPRSPTSSARPRRPSPACSTAASRPCGSAELDRRSGFSLTLHSASV